MFVYRLAALGLTAFLPASSPLGLLPSGFPAAETPALLAADDSARAVRAWDGRRHVVHEWGTFTSVQGADGVELEGLVHDPFELPPFVYDLTQRLGLSGYSPKMETPVVYFYAPEAWHVSLRVDFPNGLLTQWYPPATRANLWDKRFRLAEDHEQRVRRTPRQGYLHWGHQSEMLILPPAERPELPEVGPDDPWRFSRQVQANSIRVRNNTWPAIEARRLLDAGEELPDLQPRDEFERFLFYRGLGNFPMPLVAHISRETRQGDRRGYDLELENRVPEEALRSLFLIHVEGQRSAFCELGQLGGSARHTGLELVLRDREQVDRELVAHIAARLEETGLYTDEALAMANTWRASWFGDPGLRLLYVMHPAAVQRELPLEVAPVPQWGRDEENNIVRLPSDPEPAEMVRTFVGRLDLMTPDFEEGLLAVLADLRANSEETRETARAAVKGWGRYAEPYLRRAEALGCAAELVHEARGLLEG